MVATGQGRAHEALATQAAIGASVTAMLGAALVVRMAVPATPELADVASGRLDAFWQYSEVRSGLVAGALLVSEAGGRGTDFEGRAWSLRSKEFLAAAPDVHDEALSILGRVPRPLAEMELNA